MACSISNRNQLKVRLILDRLPPGANQKMATRSALPNLRTDEALAMVRRTLPWYGALVLAVTVFSQPLLTKEPYRDDEMERWRSPPTIKDFGLGLSLPLKFWLSDLAPFHPNVPQPVNTTQHVHLAPYVSTASHPQVAKGQILG